MTIQVRRTVLVASIASSQRAFRNDAVRYRHGRPRVKSGDGHDEKQTVGWVKPTTFRTAPWWVSPTLRSRAR